MTGTTPPAAASSPKSQKSPKSQASDNPAEITPDAAPIEVGGDDPAADDVDSTLGSEASSSSASISSSILDYRTIHGRTYHSERGNAQYWAPIDAQQNKMMDIHHHLMTLAGDEKLYLAPIEKDIETALDIGTGTGIWAIDFADEFPSTEVVGTDLSPIQPSWVPPNLKFEIEDCTQPWTFRPDSFDYVHIRYLVGSVQDWFTLFEQAYRVCRPGGWVESFEGVPIMESDDGTVSEDSAMYAWGKTFIEAGRKLGRPFTVVDDKLQEEGMKKAGLVDIESRMFKVPLGRWPKDTALRNIGIFAQEVLEGDIEGHVLQVATLAWGWSKEEVTVYCAKLRKEIRSGKHHPYYRIKIVYGRKPEES